VVVDKFEDADADGVMNLYCTILVERESQKPIVIGKGGAMIKNIGTAARSELQHHFERRVYLDLHVKVKSEWRDDERLLDEIGLNNRDR
jgi:GTP-binding protein Era